MPFLIAQLSDVHIGGIHEGNAERFSMAIEEINAMTRRPDLVLLTGDLTHHGTMDEWEQFLALLAALEVPWEAIAGNHDHGLAPLAGHRAIDAGPLRLVLVDSSSERFTDPDAEWLDSELSAHVHRPTVIAIHHPPFETGIWWMDCVGMEGGSLFESVVRRHSHVVKVLSGHVHRPIQTTWGGCSLWVCPSTAVSVAPDLDPAHEPAETAEGPMFSLHAFIGHSVVSHVVPAGAAAARALIGPNAPDFIAQVREMQRARISRYT
jgi:3',5'-cyclic-AMP phosphodiesterase